MYSRGVMVGISKILPWLINRVIIDPHGQNVFLQGSLGKEEISILGLNTPNNNQPGYRREIKSLLANAQMSSLIVMGDFNATINGALDRSNPAPPSHLARHLVSFSQYLQVLDIWHE